MNLESSADEPAHRPDLSINERAEEILEQAKRLAGQVEGWAEFSHAIFNPRDGLAAKAFPTLRERREFTMTRPYAEIYNLLYGLMRTFGGSAGAQSPPSHEQSETLRRQSAGGDGPEQSR